MPKGFMPSRDAQEQVDALARVALEKLAADVERRARIKLREAGIGRTGQLSATITSLRVRATARGLEIRVISDRQAGAQGADVATIIHQGHVSFGPKKKKALAFGGAIQGATSGGKSKFSIVVKSVRAVGGVPFLEDALRDACAASDLDWIFTPGNPRAPRIHAAPPHSG